MRSLTSWTGRAVRALAVVLTVALAGCATLPDAQPFATATSGLRVAIASSGDAAEAAVRAAGQDALAKKLRADWAKRTQVADGAVAYSDAIAAVTAAGKSGAESAGAMADSLQKMAGSLGVTPQGTAAGAFVEAAKIIYQQIAIVRASKALDEQMTAAQPAIAEIASIYDLDLKDLHATIRAADKLARMALAQEYQHEFGFQLSLRDKRNQLYAEFPKDSDQILKLDAFDDGVAKRLVPYHQRLAKLDADLKTSLALVSGTGTAVEAWAQAHQKLAAAVKSGQQVQVGVLVQTVSDLREVVRKARDQ